MKSSGLPRRRNRHRSWRSPRRPFPKPLRHRICGPSHRHRHRFRSRNRSFRLHSFHRSPLNRLWSQRPKSPARNRRTCRPRRFPNRRRLICPGWFPTHQRLRQFRQSRRHQAPRLRCPKRRRNNSRAPLRWRLRRLIQELLATEVPRSPARIQRRSKPGPAFAPGRFIGKTRSRIIPQAPGAGARRDWSCSR